MSKLQTLVCILFSMVVSSTSAFQKNRGIPEIEELIGVEWLHARLNHPKQPAKITIPDTVLFRFHRQGKDSIYLKLKQNQNIDVNAPVYTINDDGTEPHEEEITVFKQHACYHDTSNKASVMVNWRSPDSLDFEVHGSLFIDSKIFEVRPAKAIEAQWRGRRSITLMGTSHILAPLKRFRRGTNVHSVQTLQEADNSLPKTKHLKAKRAIDDTSKELKQIYRVEIAVVLDYPVFKSAFSMMTDADTLDERKNLTIEALRKHYIIVLNGIDGRYNRIDANDFQIDIHVSSIIILTKNTTAWTGGIQVNNRVTHDKVLVGLLKWFRDLTNLPPNDHVMGFTGYDITYKNNSGIIGIAYFKAICGNYRFSVQESTSIGCEEAIAAHELGHNLGANHDSVSGCDDNKQYIMAGFKSIESEFSANRWNFSTCSTSEFRDFLNTSKANCLKTFVSNATEKFRKYEESKPGQFYKGDKQCEIAFGLKHVVFREKYNNYTNICTLMQCKYKGKTKSLLIIPAEKTSCGNRKWCETGMCQSSSSAPTVPDDCVFGDEEGNVSDGKTCQDLVSASKKSCYQIKNTCCYSCRNVSSGIPGCEFGDRDNGCTAMRCARGASDSWKCCETCAASVTMTTPTVPTSTRRSENASGVTTAEDSDIYDDYWENPFPN